MKILLLVHMKAIVQIFYRDNNVTITLIKIKIYNSTYFTQRMLRPTGFSQHKEMI